MTRIPYRVKTLDRVPSREMGDVINSLRSKGKDVLALKGAPDWAPPDHVIEAAKKAAGEVTPQPSNGYTELREAISNTLSRDDGIITDPGSEILVTNGAMHALHIVFASLLEPGDEVVLHRPGFFFHGLLKLVGAVPVYAQTSQDDGWTWNAEALEKAVSPKTKLIVINSPTNPTGYVANQEDLIAVAEIARKHHLIVVSDEAYDKMVYDDDRHIRFASLPNVKDFTITVCSFTKSYAMQPWRMGYLLGPAEVVAQLRKVLEWDVQPCGPASCAGGFGRPPRLAKRAGSLLSTKSESNGSRFANCSRTVLC
jgi:aspartate/methionine/tyrosine aminotransferase